MKRYDQVPELSGLLLEESYVLDIAAHPGEVQLRIDLVLTSDHPDDGPPRPGELFCFREGLLTLHGVKRLLWLESGGPPAQDASGEVDYGHIDSYELEGAFHVLEGDWGRLEVECDGVRVELT